MKKRGLAGLLALALILALAACGGTEAQEDAAQDQKMEESCAAPGGRDFGNRWGGRRPCDHRGP